MWPLLVQETYCNQATCALPDTAKEINWGERRDEDYRGRDVNNGEVQTMGQPGGQEWRTEGKMSHITAAERTLIEIPLHQLDLKLGSVGYFTSIYFVVFIEHLLTYR